MSADDFQTKYASVMESMLKSAIAETTKLFENMVDELKAEISQIKKENEDLKTKCFEYETAKSQPIEQPRPSDPVVEQSDVSVKCDSAVQCDLVPARTVLVEKCQPLTQSAQQNQEQQFFYDWKGHSFQEHNYVSSGDKDSKPSLVFVKQEETFNYSSLESTLKQEEVDLVSGHACTFRSVGTSVDGVEHGCPFTDRETLTEEIASPPKNDKTQMVLRSSFTGITSTSEEAQNHLASINHSLVISLKDALQNDNKEDPDVCQKITTIDTPGKPPVSRKCHLDSTSLVNEQTHATVQQHEEVESTCEQLSESPLVSKKVAFGESISSEKSEGEEITQPNPPAPRRRGRPPKKLRQTKVKSATTKIPKHQEKHILLTRKKSIENSSEIFPPPTTPLLIKESGNTSMEKKNREISFVPFSVKSSSSNFLSEKQPPLKSSQLSLEGQEKATAAQPFKGSLASESQYTAQSNSPVEPSGSPRKRHTSVTLQDAMLLVEAMNQPTTEKKVTSSQIPALPQAYSVPPLCSSKTPAVQRISPVQTQLTAETLNIASQNRTLHVPSYVSPAAALTIAQSLPLPLIKVRPSNTPPTVVLMPKPSSSVTYSFTEMSQTQLCKADSVAPENSYIPPLPVEKPSIFSTLQQNINVIHGKPYPVFPLQSTTISTDHLHKISPCKKIAIIQEHLPTLQTFEKPMQEITKPTASVSLPSSQLNSMPQGSGFSAEEETRYFEENSDTTHNPNFLIQATSISETNNSDETSLSSETLVEQVTDVPETNNPLTETNLSSETSIEQVTDVPETVNPTETNWSLETLVEQITDVPETVNPTETNWSLETLVEQITDIPERLDPPTETHLRSEASVEQVTDVAETVNPTETSWSLETSVDEATDVPERLDPPTETHLASEASVEQVTDVPKTINPTETSWSLETSVDEATDVPERLDPPTETHLASEASVEQVTDVPKTIDPPTESSLSSETSVEQVQTSVSTVSLPTSKQKLCARIRLTRLPFLISTKESVSVSRLLQKGFCEITTTQKPPNPSVSLSVLAPVKAANVPENPAKSKEHTMLDKEGLLQPTLKDTSDPHLRMTKTQFLQELSVTPLPKKSSSSSGSDTKTSGQQKNSIVSRLRSHLKAISKARSAKEQVIDKQTKTSAESTKKPRLESESQKVQKRDEEAVGCKNPYVYLTVTSLNEFFDGSSFSVRKLGHCGDVIPTKVVDEQVSVSSRKCSSADDSAVLSCSRGNSSTDDLGSNNIKSMPTSSRQSTSANKSESPKMLKMSVSPRRSTSDIDLGSRSKRAASVSPGRPTCTIKNESLNLARNDSTPKRTQSKILSPKRLTKPVASPEKTTSSVRKNGTSPLMSDSLSDSTFSQVSSSKKSDKRESSSLGCERYGKTTVSTVRKKSEADNDFSSDKCPKMAKSCTSLDRGEKSTPYKKPRQSQSCHNANTNHAVTLTKAAKDRRRAKIKKSISEKKRRQLAKKKKSKVVKTCRAKVWYPPTLPPNEMPSTEIIRAPNLKVEYRIPVIPSNHSPIVSPLQPLSFIGRHLLRNQCGECGRVFETSTALENHVSLHKLNRPFTCQFCGKYFPDSKTFKRHDRVHRNGRIHVCHKCGKGFVYRFNLSKHVQMVHHRFRPFICQVCNNGFYTKRDVEIHLRIHTGEKPFQCHMCEKKFARKVELNTHLRWHNGEKRHWCSYCGKGFLDANNLKRHKYIHTGEKPHSCPHCPKKFTQTGHLKKHLQSIHKDKAK